MNRTHRPDTRRGYAYTLGFATVCALTVMLAACGPQGGTPSNIATAPSGVAATQAPPQGYVAGQETLPQTASALQGQAVPMAPNPNSVVPQGYAANANSSRIAYPGTPTSPPPMVPPPVAYRQAPAYATQDEVAPSAQLAPAARATVASAHLGEIRSIEPIRERPKGNGTGAVIGGVLGAVVGNQFGHGGGRAVTTVLGAAGGAVAGNNLERNHREGIVGYRVSVHLDNGRSRTFQETDASDLRVGDRVRVDGGRLRPV